MKIEPIDINILETEYDQFAGYVPVPTKGNLATIVDKINEIVRRLNEAGEAPQNASTE